MSDVAHDAHMYYICQIYTGAIFTVKKSIMKHEIGTIYMVCSCSSVAKQVVWYELLLYI